MVVVIAAVVVVELKLKFIKKKKHLTILKLRKLRSEQLWCFKP